MKLGGGGRNLNSCNGFTLAEVLITLGVIGFVAILIIPNILDNVQDQKYEAAKVKALVSIGAAVKEIAVLDNLSCAIDAEDFVENHIKKHLKMLKTCDNSKLSECGITPDASRKQLTKWGDLNIVGTSTIDRNAKSYAFTTADGLSVNLFYNPNCLLRENENTHNAPDRVCVNAVYDMNGASKPNMFGKDRGFVTVLYPNEEAVAVAVRYIKSAGNSNFKNAPKLCSSLGKDLVVPNIDELTAIMLHHYIIPNNSNATFHWSSTSSFGSVGYNINVPLGWAIRFNSGERFRQVVGDGGYSVYCIKNVTIK